MIAFGPIPSRRLGKSLGINNIISQKVCSYNCVYCQIGTTRRHSMKRMTFYEPGHLYEETEKHLEKLDKKFYPDYLTFVANGEPTLDRNLGKEIHLLKRFHIPIAVITNASLLFDPEVRENLSAADLVSLKVDTTSDLIWRRMNRPLESADLEATLTGITNFSAAYHGKLHTETMLLQGYNDASDHVTEIASFIASLGPLKSYLSVPTRPPAVTGVKAASEEEVMKAWLIYQKMGIDTELLTGFEGTDAGVTGNAYEDILNIAAVHPLREDTVDEILNREQSDISIVNSMVLQGLLKRIVHNGKVFYVRSYHC